MPVRNGAEYLPDALESVLGQTFADFELVVVDDGSTDATPEILATLADRRVRVVRGDGKGLVAALRTGLRCARGEYLARMDADDRCARERFERQVAWLDAHPDVVAVGSSYTVIDTEGVELRVEPTFVEDDELRRQLLVRNPFAHGSVMFRRAAFDAVGGYRDDYPTAEDYDLWRRLASAGALANVPALLYEWRASPTAISRVRIREQRLSTRRIRDELWNRSPPTILDRACLRERLHRIRRRAPEGLDIDERFDQLQLAIIAAWLSRPDGESRRHGAVQLREYLCSRPGAWLALVIFVLTCGRVTRMRRVVRGLLRRRRVLWHSARRRAPEQS